MEHPGGVGARAGAGAGAGAGAARVSAPFELSMWYMSFRRMNRSRPSASVRISEINANRTPWTSDPAPVPLNFRRLATEWPASPRNAASSLKKPCASWSVGVLFKYLNFRIDEHAGDLY